LASQTPDDGFHEIQLNGKQLVFLFMAATVVSVVIFLCGVLVGRGVRAERSASLSDATTPTIEPAPQTAPATTTPAASDPTAAAPPPTVDDLSYFNRLGKQAQPADDLKPASAGANPPASAAAKAPATARQASAAPTPAPAPAPPPPAPKPQPASAAVANPPAASAGGADGYVIQVAAMREHGDADAMARRLSAKGYSAFVMAPGAATPTMYRVRVGKFKTKREAEAVASRLQTEEQFKPWITR
jgi:cell division septation protein DedD